MSRLERSNWVPLLAQLAAGLLVYFFVDYFLGDWLYDTFYRVGEITCPWFMGLVECRAI